MSGICGWTDFTRVLGDDANATLGRMHEGLSQLAGEELLVSGGSHHRVAVIGAPGSGHTYASEDLYVVVSGELRARGRAYAERVRECGIATAVSAAYADHGSDFMAFFDGPGSAILVDSDNRRVFAVCDRLGVRPLALMPGAGTLAFSSDARVFKAMPEFREELDPQAIFNYFYFHAIPSPRTVYQGVEKLRPGEGAVLDASGFRRFFYWTPEYAERRGIAFEALAQEFKDTLKGAVQRADDGAPIGAFLSGGTDSSTISGLLRQHRGTAIDTFSIGFQADGFDETEYARLAARHFATTPHEYYLQPQDVVTAIPTIAAGYDEPFGNASVIPTYFCAKVAAEQGVRTLLAGDGGDEIFAGNARYAKQQIFEAYHWIPAALREHVIEPGVMHFPAGEKLLPVRKLRSYIQQANMPLPDRLETYNFLNRIPLAEIFQPDFLSRVNPEEPIEHLRGVYRTGVGTSALNRMMQVDLKLILADNDLRKVNKACEMAGVRVNYPMLDQAVVDFSLGVPSDLKLKGLRLRYFFKQALKDFLPQEILTKSKHGFGLPFGLWMATHEPLRELANASLDRFAARGYLQPSYLSALREKRSSEHATYYGVMIWVVMMLEQWLGTEEVR